METLAGNQNEFHVGKLLINLRFILFGLGRLFIVLAILKKES